MVKEGGDDNWKENRFILANEGSSVAINEVIQKEKEPTYCPYKID